MLWYVAVNVLTVAVDLWWFVNLVWLGLGHRVFQLVSTQPCWHPEPGSFQYTKNAKNDTTWEPCIPGLYRHVTVMIINQYQSHSIPCLHFVQSLPQGAVLHENEEERHEGAEFWSSWKFQPGVLVLHNVGMMKTWSDLWPNLCQTVSVIILHPPGAFDRKQTPKSHSNCITTTGWNKNQQRFDHSTWWQVYVTDRIHLLYILLWSLMYIGVIFGKLPKKTWNTSLYI